MAKSVHNVDVTLVGQQIVLRRFLVQNVAQEELFGEVFATGLDSGGSQYQR